MRARNVQMLGLLALLVAAAWSQSEATNMLSECRDNSQSQGREELVALVEFLGCKSSLSDQRLDILFVPHGEKRIDCSGVKRGGVFVELGAYDSEEGGLLLTNEPSPQQSLPPPPGHRCCRHHSCRRRRGRRRRLPTYSHRPRDSGYHLSNTLLLSNCFGWRGSRCSSRPIPSCSRGDRK